MSADSGASCRASLVCFGASTQEICGRSSYSGEYSEPRRLMQLAREAEEAGWDGCFLWDHLHLGKSAPTADPWIALAAIAVATSRIRIGPLVTPIFRRHPCKLARETVTLDRLSGAASFSEPDWAQTSSVRSAPSAVHWMIAFGRKCWMKAWKF